MAATEITDQTLTVFVGQQMHLRPGINKNWGVLIGGRTTWHLPSGARVVRNYHNDISTAAVTELAPEDLHKDEIIFYWVDGSLGGTSREVSADCVFKDARGEEVPKTVKATFLVKAPELVKKNSKTDTVGLFPRDSYKPESLRFGELTKLPHTRSNERIPGIQWDWAVKVPDGVDADIKDIQVKKAGCVSRQVRRDNKKTVWHCIPGEGGPTSYDQLDTSNPYTEPGDWRSAGFPRRVAAGGTCSENRAQDSPRDPLGPYEEVVRHDIFEYFVMYMPDDKKLGCPTIWVPVAKAKWYWRGEVSRSDKKMVLASADDHSVNPELEATTDFPVYRSNWKINRNE